MTEGPYVEGEKHGHWGRAELGWDAYLSEGPFVKRAERHGHWVYRSGTRMGAYR